MRPIAYVWPVQAALPEDEVWIAFEDEDHTRIGTFIARFLWGKIVETRVSSEEPLVPTELQRFPWRRFMRLAEVIHAGADSAQVSAALTGLLGVNPLPAVLHRPGRAGHPDSFYEAIAKRYLELTGAGVKAPAERIADEGHHSASTVRGWLVTCRRKGLLPARREEA